MEADASLGGGHPTPPQLLSTDEESTVEGLQDVGLDLATQYPRLLGVDPVTESALFNVLQDVLSRGLPEGWTLHQDPSRSSAYFWNEYSGVSKWVHPDHELYNMVVTAYRTAVKEPDASNALRIGWKTLEGQNMVEEGRWLGPFSTEDGFQYWHDTNRGESIWHDPVAETHRRRLVTSGLFLGLLANMQSERKELAASAASAPSQKELTLSAQMAQELKAQGASALPEVWRNLPQDLHQAGDVSTIFMDDQDPCPRPSTVSLGQNPGGAWDFGKTSDNLARLGRNQSRQGPRVKKLQEGLGPFMEGEQPPSPSGSNPSHPPSPPSNGAAGPVIRLGSHQEDAQAQPEPGPERAAASRLSSPLPSAPMSQRTEGSDCRGRRDHSPADGNKAKRPQRSTERARNKEAIARRKKQEAAARIIQFFWRLFLEKRALQKERKERARKRKQHRMTAAKSKAAVAIQRRWRGIQSRVYFNMLLLEQRRQTNLKAKKVEAIIDKKAARAKAAVTLQRRWRGVQARMVVGMLRADQQARVRRAELQARRATAASRVQSAWRGFQASRLRRDEEQERSRRELKSQMMETGLVRPPSRNGYTDEQGARGSDLLSPQTPRGLDPLVEQTSPQSGASRTPVAEPVAGARATAGLDVGEPAPPGPQTPLELSLSCSPTGGGEGTALALDQSLSCSDAFGRAPSTPSAAGRPPGDEASRLARLAKLLKRQAKPSEEGSESPSKGRSKLSKAQRHREVMSQSLSNFVSTVAPEASGEAEQQCDSGKDERAAPEDATPSPAAPEDPAPEHAAPKDAAQKDVAPKAAPKEAAPKEAVPKDVAPKDVAPVDVAPVDVAPVDEAGEEASSPQEMSKKSKALRHRESIGLTMGFEAPEVLEGSEHGDVGHGERGEPVPKPSSPLAEEPRSPMAEESRTPTGDPSARLAKLSKLLKVPPPPAGKPPGAAAKEAAAPSGQESVSQSPEKLKRRKKATSPKPPKRKQNEDSDEDFDTDAQFGGLRALSAFRPAEMRKRAAGEKSAMPLPAGPDPASPPRGGGEPMPEPSPLSAGGGGGMWQRSGSKPGAQPQPTLGSSASAPQLTSKDPRELSLAKDPKGELTLSPVKHSERRRQAMQAGRQPSPSPAPSEGEQRMGGTQQTRWRPPREPGGVPADHLQATLPLRRERPRRSPETSLEDGGDDALSRAARMSARPAGHLEEPRRKPGSAFRPSPEQSSEWEPRRGTAPRREAQKPGTSGMTASTNSIGTSIASSADIYQGLGSRSSIRSTSTGGGTDDGREAGLPGLKGARSRGGLRQAGATALIGRQPSPDAAHW